MTPITELDVVNACLQSVGEAPLNSIEEYHPYIASARTQLEFSLQTVQAKKYWFGYERAILQAEVGTGYVYVPGDAIDVQAHNTANQLVQRGSRLYDVVEGTFDIGEPVTVTLVRYLPLADLPVMAQHLVLATTVLDFQSNSDGDPQTAREWAQRRQLYEIMLNAEHIRQVKANFLARASTGMIRRHIIGGNNTTYIPR